MSAAADNKQTRLPPPPSKNEYLNENKQSAVVDNEIETVTSGYLGDDYNNIIQNDEFVTNGGDGEGGNDNQIISNSSGQTIGHYHDNNLQNDERWESLRAVKNNNVFAVDANSYFSKPSVRTITGLEILAKIIHPEIFEKLNVPANSFEQIKS